MARMLKVTGPGWEAYSGWKKEGSLWICHLSSIKTKFLVGLDHFQARRELVKRDLKWEWMGQPVEGDR